MSDNIGHKEFESWVLATYAGTDYATSRTHQGTYYSTVAHRAERTTYASVQMLWEAWRSGRRAALAEREKEVERLWGEIVAIHERIESGSYWKFLKDQLAAERQRARLPDDIMRELRAAFDGDPAWTNFALGLSGSINLLSRILAAVEGDK